MLPSFFAAFILSGAWDGIEITSYLLLLPRTVCLLRLFSEMELHLPVSRSMRHALFLAIHHHHDVFSIRIIRRRCICRISNFPVCRPLKKPIMTSEVTSIIYEPEKSDHNFPRPNTKKQDSGDWKINVETRKGEKKAEDCLKKI
jgi:hypothetical protein